MKRNKRGVRIPAVLLGALLGTALILLLCMLFGALMVRNMLPESMAKVTSVVALVLGTVAASLFSVKSRKEKKLPTCLVTGGILLLLLMLAHSICFRGVNYQFTATLAAVVCTAVVTGTAISLQKKKHRY
ncbi:MAG: TIGR04086 family membrane protein [Oscillospiraceae bacterium]|nr:TIGR04086 family membrane protein [Oscillospiraceae bacterium]